MVLARIFKPRSRENYRSILFTADFLVPRASHHQVIEHFLRFDVQFCGCKFIEVLLVFKYGMRNTYFLCNYVWVRDVSAMVFVIFRDASRENVFEGVNKTRRNYSV